MVVCGVPGDLIKVGHFNLRLPEYFAVVCGVPGDLIKVGYFNLLLPEYFAVVCGVPGGLIKVCHDATVRSVHSKHSRLLGPEGIVLINPIIVSLDPIIPLQHQQPIELGRGYVLGYLA